MDEHGRVPIPAEVRRAVGAELFALEVGGEGIVLRPLRLPELFDAVEVEDFANRHALGRALHG